MNVFDRTSQVIALVMVLLMTLSALPAEAAERPNFVWLISEDNSIHFMKLFDETGPATPNIEKLAEQGLVFENAFSNAPVCSVARSTLITSCLAPRIGTQFHRKEKIVPMPEGVRMFPAYLRDAGYYTTNKSKKDYNAVEGEGVWDESSAKAHWSKRKAGQSFFHKQSFGTTHESSLHFKAATMETPTKTDADSVFIPPVHPDTPTFRYTYARYHDRIQEMDGQIGAIVDQLANEGLLEDTFIFYFGDHGGVLPGSKGYANERGVNVPLVVRVPKNWKHLVDTELGSRMKGFVSFIDFGPTLLNLAGLEAPEGVDGQAFLGKDIAMADVNARDEVFCYADRFDEKYDHVRTLRKGKLKYVRNYQPFNFDGLQNDYRYKMLAYEEWRQLYQAGELNAVQRQFFEPRPAEQLFDVEADPYETKNLAGDPEYADVLTEMRGRMLGKVRSICDLSFYPESYLVDEAFDNPAKFGYDHRYAICRMSGIANWSVLPFDEVEERIGRVLDQKQPWNDYPWYRYWALIVCSSHGQAAAGFAETAKKIAADDPELLVRVRAAEFLGLIGAADPRPVITDCLLKSESVVEANLILNTAVLLQDGEPGYRFDLPRGKIIGDRPDASVRYVKARLDYLAR